MDTDVYASTEYADGDVVYLGTGSVVGTIATGGREGTSDGSWPPTSKPGWEQVSATAKGRLTFTENHGFVGAGDALWKDGGEALESVSGGINLTTDEWNFVQTPSLIITSSLIGFDEVKSTNSDWKQGNQFRLRLRRNDAFAGDDIQFFATGAEVKRVEASGTIFEVLAGTGSTQLSAVAASSAEPVLNLQNTEFSHKNAYGDKGWNSSSFGETSTLHGVSFSSTNSLEDPLYGFDFYSTLSALGSHSTSSIFRYVDTNTPRNNSTNFGYPDTNQGELSAYDRSQWIIKLASNYDSWYDQFL